MLLGLPVHLLLPQLATLAHALAVLRGMSRPLVLPAISAQITSDIGSGYLLQSGVSLLKQRITIYPSNAVPLLITKGALDNILAVCTHIAICTETARCACTSQDSPSD